MDGDNAKASSTVEEAIKVATERHARVPECLARIVRAQLLLRATGDDEKAEGARELARAKGLMQETGAALFEPFINGNMPHDSSRQVSSSAI
jgi:adenylate cyclase